MLTFCYVLVSIKELLLLLLVIVHPQLHLEFAKKQINIRTSTLDITVRPIKKECSRMVSGIKMNPEA